MEGDYVTTVGEWIDRIVEDAVNEALAEIAEKDAILAEMKAKIVEYEAEIRQLEEEKNKK